MRDTFRGDVEGLRAAAVLPILLFHLDPRLVPGGYMGVDVFFVISGYLITQMILRDRHGFRFKAFYIRRFFRLFPALLVTLLSCLTAGWWVLSPGDYAQLATSGLTAAFGVSNVYFLQSIDYFNAASLSHPLLHTWSLGAEEQFYLLWPALLVAAARIRIPFIVLVIVAGVASFAAVAVLQERMPDGAFYMMPFRIFEFAIGAALLAVERWWQSLPAALRHGGGLLGAGLLAGALAFVDTETPWPGVATLAPAVATGLLILAGRDGFWKAVLANPVSGFFGRISYSLYLVHWPIITLYRTYAVTEPGPFELVALGAASIAAGAALYYAVESPCRAVGRNLAGREIETEPSSWAASYVYPGLGVVTIAFLVGAAAVWATKGFPYRLETARVQTGAEGLTFAGDICSYRRTRCVFGNTSATKTVYLIGDSHGLNLLYGLDRALREWGIKGIAFYDHGCLFVEGTTRFRRGAEDQRCTKSISDAYDYVRGHEGPVIIAGNWVGYKNSIGHDDGTGPLRGADEVYYAFLEDKLRSSLSGLAGGSRKIVLVKQTYSTGVNLAKCLAEPGTVGTGKCTSQTRAALNERTKGADELISRLAAALPRVVVIDPKDIFCSTDPCLTQGAGGLYFRDSDHLTNPGSEFLIEGVKSVLKGVLTGD